MKLYQVRALIAASTYTVIHHRIATDEWRCVTPDYKHWDDSLKIALDLMSCWRDATVMHIAVNSITGLIEITCEE